MASPGFENSKKIQYLIQSSLSGIIFSTALFVLFLSVLKLNIYGANKIPAYPIYALGLYSVIPVICVTGYYIKTKFRNTFCVPVFVAAAILTIPCMVYLFNFLIRFDFFAPDYSSLIE